MGRSVGWRDDATRRMLGRVSRLGSAIRACCLGPGAQDGRKDFAVGGVDVGPAHRLLDEGRALVRFGQVEVLFVRTGRGVFAVENRCPHAGRDLSDAAVSGRTLVCPGHNRGYDLASGAPTGRTGVRIGQLRTFRVAVIAGRLWLWPREEVVRDG
jgi:nitrite reductase/ring-hydroxylating ferredoxin subunit